MIIVNLITIPLSLIPVGLIVFLIFSIIRYKEASNPEEKSKNKTIMIIAIVLSALMLLLLAILFVVFILWAIALGNMT